MRKGTKAKRPARRAETVEERDSRERLAFLRRLDARQRAIKALARRLRVSTEAARRELRGLADFVAAIDGDVEPAARREA
jgi:hypothetical protein